MAAKVKSPGGEDCGTQFQCFGKLSISRNEEETLMLQQVQQDFSVRITNILEAERTRLLLPESAEVRSSVLVLPKLNPWADYLTQNVIEKVFTSLVSFSVGPEGSKRIVVCDEKVVQRKVIADSMAQSDLSPVGTMQEPINVVLEAIVTVDEESSTMKPKKPEKQLYVPRGKRVPVSPKPAVVPVPVGNGTMKSELDMISSPCADHISGYPQPETDHFWTQLKKSQLVELFNIVGEVEILKPEWEDFGYDMQITIQNHLVEHIIEAYNFDKTFTAKDITNVLSEFQESGFSIKWIDDSHALLIFRNTESAAEALTIRHPILQLRPVVIASRDAKLKIKRNSELLLPFKERPVTVPTVARRLISSSLGIRTKITPTLLKEEEDILQRAREDKQRRRQHV